eukprot:Selendium_serpulae@DN4874_c0_g1_i1.p1
MGNTDFVVRLKNAVSVVWEFSRPHTLIGSFLSIFSLLLYSSPDYVQNSHKFVFALISGFGTNVFITGLNQITDLEIDLVNKPYLPIPAGKLSVFQAWLLVIWSTGIAVVFSHWPPSVATRPMRYGTFICLLFGVLYSAPPFRFKRYPSLASSLIITARGVLINMCFYCHYSNTPLKDCIWISKCFFPTIFICFFFVGNLINERHT